MTACPPDLLHRESIKDGGEEGGDIGGRAVGGKETSDCAGEGVTYEVTTSAFWTVRQRDEKVASFSRPRRLW